MTVQDIISLCNAGFTAQQITQMAQPQMAQPQMAQPQMAQPQITQMAQPQITQMAQPQITQMAQPQITQMAQPQMAQPQMAQPQMAQQYVPVLPAGQSDPMKDIMLQQYTNAGQNMYNVNNVVSEMIGANAPAKTGGAK